MRKGALARINVGKNKMKRESRRSERHFEFPEPNALSHLLLLVAL
ncbi:hypothetical protein PRIPAC_95520 [Pristionchus pacificus]|nr:hypothetical protein PRIPAC_95520 [Pristionchus pacificus]